MTFKINDNQYSQYFSDSWASYLLRNKFSSIYK